MESDPKHAAELARLRGLGAWMQEVGASELVLGDVHIRLAPSKPSPPVLSAADRDEAKVLAEERAAEEGLSEEERAHRRYWRRATRSSGAPIPPFRPREPKGPQQ